MTEHETEDGHLVCQDCGEVSEKVRPTTCPYQAEIFGETLEIAVCPDCYSSRAEDI